MEWPWNVCGAFAEATGRSVNIAVFRQRNRCDIIARYGMTMALQRWQIWRECCHYVETLVPYAQKRHLMNDVVWQEDLVLNRRAIAANLHDATRPS